MMAIEITFVEKPPKWGGKPGRLYIPTPRHEQDALEAVEKLLANSNVKRITIEIERPEEPHR